jgi:hypothetical protein
VDYRGNGLAPRFIVSFEPTSSDGGGLEEADSAEASHLQSPHTRQRITPVGNACFEVRYVLTGQGLWRIDIQVDGDSVADGPFHVLVRPPITAMPLPLRLPGLNSIPTHRSAGSSPSGALCSHVEGPGAGPGPR